VSEETGKPLCPLSLVDRIFETAEELHKSTAARLATYQLETCADPPFSPWDATFQRLSAGGLLPTGPVEEDMPGMFPRRPLVLRLAWDGGDAVPTCSTALYDDAAWKEQRAAGAELEWALLEAATRDAPPVLLGVPRVLLVPAEQEARPSGKGTSPREAPAEAASAGATGAPSPTTARSEGGAALLPPLSSEVSQVRLPASLLQKSVRRGFCSSAPLLEACTALLHGKGEGGAATAAPPRGGPFAMLSTLWGAMLVDAAPFDAPADGAALGIEQLLALSLIARADPGWAPPPPLARKAVAAALRTQGRDCNQWLGFMDKFYEPKGPHYGWSLVPPPPPPPEEEDEEEEEEEAQEEEGRAGELRNTLLVAQAAVGGAIRWGRWDRFDGEPAGASAFPWPGRSATATVSVT